MPERDNRPESNRIRRFLKQRGETTAPLDPSAVQSREPRTSLPGDTGRLNAEQRRSLTIPGPSAFGPRFTPEEITYHPVPYNYRSIPRPNRWRVILKFNDPAPRITVGLDIFGDVILGRGSERSALPDIDLANLRALDLGVSRRHAMLRPTQNRLFLIDLESTNGSYVNAIPVGRGMAQRVQSSDLVSLAGLTFHVEVVLNPKGEKYGVDYEDESSRPSGREDNSPTFKVR